MVQSAERFGLIPERAVNRLVAVRVFGIEEFGVRVARPHVQAADRARLFVQAEHRPPGAVADRVKPLRNVDPGDALAPLVERVAFQLHFAEAADVETGRVRQPRRLACERLVEGDGIGRRVR